MKKQSVFDKRYLVLIVVGIALVFLLCSEFFQSDEDSAAILFEAQIEEKLVLMIETLDGISKADVLVTLESYEEGKGSPKVRGVAIICHGRVKEETKVKIIMMASTALGVSSDKIFVSWG